ncbi:hypothetical protein BKA62DRAFT_733538, partial [Auriculariales sp. MPI-PUGE-AT-0066]
MLQRHGEVRLWYSTFSCPQVPPSAATPAPPRLADFIAYRTWLPSCVAFTALYLLARLKAWFPLQLSATTPAPTSRGMLRARVCSHSRRS